MRFACYFASTYEISSSLEDHKPTHIIGVPFGYTYTRSNFSVCVLGVLVCVLAKTFNFVMIYPSKLCEILICCIKTCLEQGLGAGSSKIFKILSPNVHASALVCVESSVVQDFVFGS